MIEATHDNRVSLCHNDQPVTNSDLLSDLAGAHSELEGLETFLREQSLEDLRVLVKQLNSDDLSFLRAGIQYNPNLAESGMDFGCGLGVGKTLKRPTREGLLKKDRALPARILTSVACDARMSGAKLPGMSSAGSGNHGLTAVLPVWAVSQYLSDVDEIDVLKAIALSHVVTGYIRKPPRLQKSPRFWCTGLCHDAL